MWRAARADSFAGTADPGRRRWTATHELGHPLMGDEYHADAGVHSSRDERERLIDAFAGEFLLPADGLRRRWHERDDDERSRLIRIAAAYRVSCSAVIEAARDPGLLGQPSAQQLRSDRPVRGDFLGVLGAEPVPDLRVGTTGHSLAPSRRGGLPARIDHC